jgi:hypothetical protein
MRRYSAVAIAVVLSTAALGAQAPAAKKGAAPAANKPAGTLAQMMRGIYFPNANVLFDVQSVDPATPPKEIPKDDPRATVMFANIYTGWQVVENAAIAMAESTPLFLAPGRLCQNGKPVPINQPDYRAAVENMRVQALKMLEIARTKNLEAASDQTNEVAGACAQCHEVYRDVGDANSPNRCTPPAK